mmetsp:Transcript_25675/g.60183  ORF Transcript_25675/g.60183 Transcript_25675/m.60183 type:complete len:314 (-) Transcript_25675:820-1761(-)
MMLFFSDSFDFFPKSLTPLPLLWIALPLLLLMLMSSEVAWACGSLISGSFDNEEASVGSIGVSVLSFFVGATPFSAFDCFAAFEESGEDSTLLAISFSSFEELRGVSLSPNTVSVVLLPIVLLLMLLFSKVVELAFELVAKVSELYGAPLESPASSSTGVATGAESFGSSFIRSFPYGWSKSVPTCSSGKFRSLTVRTSLSQEERSFGSLEPGRLFKRFFHMIRRLELTLSSSFTFALVLGSGSNRWRLFPSSKVISCVLFNDCGMSIGLSTEPLSTSVVSLSSTDLSSTDLSSPSSSSSSRIAFAPLFLDMP